MNPLDVSWAKKPPASDPPKKEASEPQFLGVRNEASKVSGPDVVVFEVRGVPGLPSGTLKVRYSKGASLRWYLRQLRLLNVVSRAAIYDVGSPGRGRLRLRHVLTLQSRVLLMPPTMSPSTHLQRSSVDASRVASKMKTEEVNL